MNLASADLKVFLEDCEKAIQLGRGGDCHKDLELHSKQVPASLRLQYANICRRVGLIDLALKILSPRIRNEKIGTSLDTTDDELVEYALLLQRIGAISESHWILDKIDYDKSPKGLLHKAFGHFIQWEHGKSIPYLLTYLDKDISQYDALIGRLNLALAHCITHQLDSALEIAKACEEVASEMGKARILGNCFELQTQIYLLMNDNLKAKESLQRATQILSTGHSTFDNIYIKKWKAYFSFLQSGDPRDFAEVSKMSESQQYFETLRELDLFKLRLQFKQNSARHLLYGTPFEGYRQRIHNWTKQEIDASSDYLWGNSRTDVIDLCSGTWNGKSFLPLGKKSHQLLDCLSRDLYSPQRVGDIFSHLFPNDYFDIHTSPGRVQKVISRTQQFLKDQNCPLKIRVESGFYSLLKEDRVNLRIPLQRQSVAGFHAHLQSLKKRFGIQHAFRTDEACQTLKIKPGKMRYIINQALESGKLHRIGHGNASLYRIAE